MKNLIYILILSLLGCSESSHKRDPEPVLALDPSEYVYTLASENNWSIKNYSPLTATLHEQLETVKSSDLDHVGVAIMLVGNNDMRAYGLNVVRLNQFRDDLNELLTLLTKRNIDIYIGTTLKMLPEMNTDAEALAYANGIKYVVSSLNSNKVHLVDTYESFEPKPQYYRDDKIYLNSEGNKAIADIFRASINGERSLSSGSELKRF